MSEIRRETNTDEKMGLDASPTVEGGHFQEHENNPDLEVASALPNLVAEKLADDETGLSSIRDELGRINDLPGVEVLPDNELSQDVIRMFERSPIVRKEIQRRLHKSEVTDKHEQIKRDIIREYLQYLANPSEFVKLTEGAFAGSRCLDGMPEEEKVLTKRINDDPGVKEARKNVKSCKLTKFVYFFIDSGSFRVSIQEELDKAKKELRAVRVQVQAKIAQEYLSAGTMPESALFLAQEPETDADRGLSPTDEES